MQPIAQADTRGAWYRQWRVVSLDGSTMLRLADRGFFGFQMWQAALATQAQLLWRTKKDMRFSCEQRLSNWPLRKRHATPTARYLLRSHSNH